MLDPLSFISEDYTKDEPPFDKQKDDVDQLTGVDQLVQLTQNDSSGG